MSKPRRVTIKEIAEEAGVSMQTVSRVLNNRPDVASETRARVKAIIAAHNYRPSSVARGITQGRSYILGVISAGLQYHGPAGTLMGIEKHARELGYTLILRVVQELENFDIDEHLNFFVSQHIDGMVWTLPEIGDLREDVIQETPRLQIPSIFLNMREHPALTVVDFDNKLGGRMAVEHLIEQGCHTIGILQGPMSWLSAQQRHQGWREALVAAGLPVSEDLAVEGDWTASSGERAMARLLEQRPDVDGVFVSNDIMALGAMTAARLAGRRIPQDVALVGYDNLPETNFYFPPLTTITNDFESISYLTVKLLDQMITAADQDEAAIQFNSHFYEPTLVIRESSLKSG